MTDQPDMRGLVTRIEKAGGFLVPSLLPEAAQRERVVTVEIADGRDFVIPLRPENDAHVGDWVTVRVRKEKR